MTSGYFCLFLIAGLLAGINGQDTGAAVVKTHVAVELQPMQTRELLDSGAAQIPGMPDTGMMPPDAGMNTILVWSPNSQSWWNIKDNGGSFIKGTTATPDVLGDVGTTPAATGTTVSTASAQETTQAPPVDVTTQAAPTVSDEGLTSTDTAIQTTETTDAPTTSVTTATTTTTTTTATTQVTTPAPTANQQGSNIVYVRGSTETQEAVRREMLKKGYLEKDINMILEKMPMITPADFLQAQADVERQRLANNSVATQPSQTPTSTLPPNQPQVPQQQGYPSNQIPPYQPPGSQLPGSANQNRYSGGDVNQYAPPTSNTWPSSPSWPATNTQNTWPSTNSQNTWPATNTQNSWPSTNSQNTWPSTNSQSSQSSGQVYAPSQIPGSNFPTGPNPGTTFPGSTSGSSFPSRPSPGSSYPSIPSSGSSFPSRPTPGSSYPSIPSSGSSAPSMPSSGSSFPSRPPSSSYFPSGPSSASSFPTGPSSGLPAQTRPSFPSYPNTYYQSAYQGYNRYNNQNTAQNTGSYQGVRAPSSGTPPGVDSSQIRYFGQGAGQQGYPARKPNPFEAYRSYPRTGQFLPPPPGANTVVTTKAPSTNSQQVAMGVIQALRVGETPPQMIYMSLPKRLQSSTFGQSLLANPDAISEIAESPAGMAAIMRMFQQA